MGTQLCCFVYSSGAGFSNSLDFLELASLVNALSPVEASLLSGQAAMGQVKSTLRTGTRRSVTRLLARGQRAPRGRRGETDREQRNKSTARPLRDNVLLRVISLRPLLRGQRAPRGRQSGACQGEEDPAICSRFFANWLFSKQFLQLDLS